MQTDANKTASDDWRVRAALKPKEHYELEDFPVGKRIVCERVRDGRIASTGYALVEVIDAYQLRASSQRYLDYGLCIFGRVIAVDAEFLDGTVGHVVGMSLAPRGQWWGGKTDMRVTTISPKAIRPRPPEGRDGEEGL